jgi:hypothetical protein
MLAYECYATVIIHFVYIYIYIYKILGRHMRKYGTHCVLCEDRLGPLEGLTEGVILPRGSFYRGHFTDGVTIEGGYSFDWVTTDKVTQ